MDYFSDPLFVTVFTVVLLSRFLLPLTIIRWPRPGVVACLVLDAADQTIFQSFGYDPPFYQGYDKAMDVVPAPDVARALARIEAHRKTQP